MRRLNQVRRSALYRAGQGLAVLLALTLAMVACDSGGGSKMQNSPPSAQSNSFPAATGAKLAREAPGLLKNDSDPDRDELSVNPSPVSGPSNGSLTLNADGSFEYTSEEGFTGEDSFTYEVTDGNGGSDQATVTVTVKDVEYATDVQPIFESSCGGSGCHLEQQTSGVLLDSKEATLNSEGDEYGTLIVEAGDASRAASPLADKILPNPLRGERMPLDAPALEQEEITTIRAWIEGLEPTN